MFKFKTPHRKPMAHAARFYGYFAYATFLVGMLLQARLTLPTLSTFGALLITSVIAMAGGLFVTAFVRWLFGLVQTGRVVQYAGFWAGAYAGVRASSALLPGVIWHSSPALESLLIVILAFGLAIYMKEVPWKGRTWLPVAKKRSGGGSHKSVFLQRARLLVKAEFLSAFGSERSSRQAWKALVQFETIHFPADSVKRAHALTQLALSYMRTGGEVYLLSAKELLTVAHDNLVNDKATERNGFATVAQTLGHVEQRLGNWHAAVQFHEEAEQNFLVTWPVSYHRAHNLKDLSRCYQKCSNWFDASWCDKEAERLLAALLLRPRSLSSY